MKKIISLALITAATGVYADISTQEFLYKDPRIVGAGSANTAVGGYSTAVFYNPAGLINIKKSHGVEVELLGLTASASSGIKDFIDDLDNANTDQEVLDVAKKYSGDAFHANVSNYSSVSYHTEDDLAFSIGLLGAADLNLIPHANSGANGVLETHSRAYGGVVLGVAQKFDDVLPGNLTIGVGAKYITQYSYEAGLDAGEISQHNDDLETYIRDTYEEKNSGFGVDIGLLYAPKISDSIDALNTSIGFSVMNIGNLDFDAYGAQPMTCNVGLAIAPEVPFTDMFKLSVDYVDIFNAQQARVIDTVAGVPTYKSIESNFELMQHLRAGATIGLIDNSWFMMTLNGGLYQGAYTAGVDMQLAILKIQAATYQEQLGATIGQLEDRRYVVGLGIGW
ncbi:hypothetical protein [Sulfurimonas microaerophilic]|uniref:hypothetical protein n=1 Tax=Sulfurimonas microaerophilic TaxID=3058392 RepID=UPI00271512EA|nr:hypothetical protein [Sulfurimonas sp. hsl 1-7]